MTVALAEPETITDGDRRLVDRSFGGVGAVAWRDTEARIVEQPAAAARGLGFDAEAAALLARQTAIGAGTLLAEDERGAEDLRSPPTSPGGTTRSGLAVPEAPTGLPALLAGAVRAAHARPVQIGALSASPRH